MSQSPGLLDLTLAQGSTWSISMTYQDANGSAIDLTGYEARMQARESYGAAVPVLSLTDGSGITLGGTAGTINVNVAATATTEINAAQYVYDLELISESVVTRLIQGTLIVTPEVTR